MMPAPEPSTASKWPSDDAQDRLWLQAVAAGERGALERLYRAHHARLDRFLLRAGGSRELVEEVINDVFMVVWRKASDFRGQSRVSTWLVGIAYRCLLVALRQRPSDECGGFEEALADLGNDPNPDHERNEWLLRGMAQLPPEQRSALVLAYYFGHSLEEVAEITDCPVTTVKARMFHGRVRLRHLLPLLAGEVRAKVFNGNQHESE